MKKIAALIIGFTLLGSVIWAQEDLKETVYYKNAIAVDPVLIIFNTYKASYERLLVDQISLKVDIAYSPNFFWGLHQYDPLTYLDVIVHGRYYIGSLLKGPASEVNIGKYSDIVKRVFTDGPGGLYVDVFAGYVNSRVGIGTDEDYVLGNFNGFGGGLEAGIKYIFGKGRVSFFLEPNVMVRYYMGGYSYKDKAGAVAEKPEDFADGFDRNGIAGGVAFGLVF